MGFIFPFVKTRLHHQQIKYLKLKTSENERVQLGIVVHYFNPSTQEAGQADL